MIDLNVLIGGQKDDVISAWLPIVLSLVAIVVSVVLHRKGERRAALEQYWFREVVAPNCVTPIVDMNREWLLKLDGLAVNRLSRTAMLDLIESYTRQTGNYLAGVHVMRVVAGAGFHNFCQAQLETCEDVLARELALMHDGRSTASGLQSMKSAFMESTVNILREAARIHSGPLR